MLSKYANYFSKFRALIWSLSYLIIMVLVVTTGVLLKYSCERIKQHGYGNRVHLDANDNQKDAHELARYRKINFAPFSAKENGRV
eukprot:SAG31_NODE_38194_length_298_cov_0.773869_1_plen_84_part_01